MKCTTINQSILSRNMMSQNNNNSQRVQVSLPVMNGLVASHKRFAESVIEALAGYYKFPKDEAIHLFLHDVVGEEPVRKPRVAKTKEPKAPKVKRQTPAFPLPWTGEVVEYWCKGLRLNQGLHTQCCMEPLSGGLYCKTCQKQADANSNGVPTYGNTDMRMQVGLMEYRDPKDKKQSVPYASIMKKLNISAEDARCEAMRFGLTIPEEQFEERKLSRGRPKKDASASDTDSSTSSSSSKKEKKSRGRPKKQAKVVETSEGDDLIAQLVSQASSAAQTPAVPQLTIKVNEDGPEFVDLDSAKKPTPPAPAPLSQNVTVRKPKMDKAALAAKKQAQKEADEKRKAEEELARIAKAKKEAEELRKREELAQQQAQGGDEEEAEDVDYEEKEVDGVKYAFAEDFLYSLTTGDCVGYLNPETGKIEEVEDDE